METSIQITGSKPEAKAQGFEGSHRLYICLLLLANRCPVPPWLMAAFLWPQVLGPNYWFSYFLRNGSAGWRSLSGVILCITG